MFGSAFRGGDSRHLKQAAILFSYSFGMVQDGLDWLQSFWVMLIKQKCS